MPLLILLYLLKKIILLTIVATSTDCTYQSDYIYYNYSFYYWLYWMTWRADSTYSIDFMNSNNSTDSIDTINPTDLIYSQSCLYWFYIPDWFYLLNSTKVTGSIHWLNLQSTESIGSPNSNDSTGLLTQLFLLTLVILLTPFYLPYFLYWLYWLY